MSESIGYNDEQAFDTYLRLHATFVRSHPFADGNGRIARLVANLPVLCAGKPPVLLAGAYCIPYLRALAQWQMDQGKISGNGEPCRDHPALERYGPCSAQAGRSACASWRKHAPRRQAAINRHN